MQIPYDSIFELSPSIMLLLDRESGTVVTLNQRAREALDWDESGTGGLASLAEAEAAQRFERELRSLSNERQGAAGRLPLRSGPVLVYTLRLLPDDDAVLMVARQMKRGASTYERLASVFHGAHLPILVWDRDGRIHEVNRAFSEWTGQDDLGGKNLSEMFEHPLPEANESLDTRLRREKGALSVRVEARELEADGERLVVGFVTDRSGAEREASLQQSLAQAQRLEALGRMAAGIAHEFNNMLMAALPWADLIRRKYSSDETLVKAADHIRRSVHRARDITRQLLDFGQPRTPAPAAIDLAALLRQQHKLLTTAAEGREIELETTGNGRVWADPAQIAQALLNIGLFARNQSDPETTIRLRSLPADQDQMSILVSWKGSPLGQAELAALFDPFAASEDARKGGLALSVARRIVEQNGGRVMVTSDAERTELEISLPLAPQAAQPTEPDDGWKLEGMAILIADDDVAAIAGLLPLLQEKGASVHLVTNAADAMLTAAAAPVDVAIVDSSLSDCTPAQFTSAMFKSRPRSRIIFISGDSGAEAALPPDPRIAFLAKPFELDDLMRRLAALASAPSPSLND